VIRSFVSDGESAGVIHGLCVQILKGRVLQGVGVDGRAFTAGRSRHADGTETCVLLAWPHGIEEASGDAFDVVTAFVAQLPPGHAERVLVHAFERESGLRAEAS
jgi:hypothetical protein